MQIAFGRVRRTILSAKVKKIRLNVIAFANVLAYSSGSVARYFGFVWMWGG